MLCTNAGLEEAAGVCALRTASPAASSMSDSDHELRLRRRPRLVRSASHSRPIGGSPTQTARCHLRLPTLECLVAVPRGIHNLRRGQIWSIDGSFYH